MSAIGLKKQVSRPVLWQSTMDKMLQESALDHFAEIGTGKVLAGLMKRAARDRQREVQICEHRKHDRSEKKCLKTSSAAWGKESGEKMP